MADKPNKAVQAVGVVTAVAAAILGKLLGWMFGLQLLLPLVAGVVALELFKKKMKPEGQPFVPALALQSAYLAWVLVGILVMAINGNLYMGIQGIILHFISVVAFIALIVQPGVPPALLLLLRHAWSLVLVLISVPNMIKHSEYVSRLAIVDTILVLGFSVAAIVLLLRGILASNKT